MWLRRWGWLLIVAVLALAVRLHHNLVEHPPGDFLFVDMRGYVDRADALLRQMWRILRGRPLPDDNPYDTLWPYGTHVLLFFVKLLTGPRFAPAAAVVLAALGAATSVLTALLARELTHRRVIAFLVGALSAVYFPLISLGGYYLSEVPFAVCVTASAYLSLRLARRPRPATAWLLGVSLALGATVRPQILLYAAALLAVLALSARARAALPRIAAPIALVLVASAVRFHALTGEVGFISSNGAMNLVFGRCHNYVLDVELPGFRMVFAPAAMGALRAHEVAHPGSPIRLDAAHVEPPPRGKGAVQRAIASRAPASRAPAAPSPLVVHAHLHDEEALRAVAADCVKKTGIVRQIRYSLTHVVMLWHTNELWPDGDTPRWGGRVREWSWIHNRLILPAAAAALLAGLARRRRGHVYLALPLAALVATAMIYFGDTRFRVPHDGILIALAADGYARAAKAVVRVLAAALAKLH